MIGQVARVLAALLATGLAGGSWVITGYLIRLEQGIEQDLETVRQMVAVQQSIRHQNEILTEMVAVTDRIGAGLESLLSATGTIEGQVGLVGEANRATLALNRLMEAENAAAATELQRVVTSLQQMNQASARIADDLAHLRSVVAGDTAALRAIAENTARMNLRTPGW